MESLAKLFKNGRSQAVRLPKEFRFEGTEVRICKQGEKAILEPVKKSKWPDGFWDIFTPDPQFDIPNPFASIEFQLTKLGSDQGITPAALGCDDRFWPQNVISPAKDEFKGKGSSVQDQWLDFS